MRAEETLVRNSFVYSLGNFAPKAVGFFLIPLYSAYLSPKEFGAFDIVMVTVSLISPFLSMGVEHSIYRYLLDVAKGESIKKILSNGSLIILRNLLIFDVICIAVILNFQFRYSWYFLALLNVSLMSGVLAQAARALGKIPLVSFVNILSCLVTVGANLYLVIHVGLKVEALLISNIIAQAVVVVILVNRLGIISSFSISALEKEVRWKFLRYSLPLVFSAASWWIMISSDRYLLTYFCGLEATGLYSMASKFPSLVIVLYLGFALSWQDTAIASYASKERHLFYSKVFNKLATLLLSGVIILIPTSRMMLQLFVHKNFHAAWVYMPLLYLSAVCYAFCSFYSVAFHCAKKSMGSFYTSGIGALFNIICNFVFIPLWGLHGAACSTFLSYSLVWIARRHWTRNYFPVEIEWTRFLILGVLSLIMSILVYFNPGNVGTILMISLSTVIFAFCNYSVMHKASFVLLKRLRYAG